MYNLTSHYENIFHYIKNIVAHRRVLYLHPFGSTQPENIETLDDDLEELNAMLYKELRAGRIDEGPLLIFYDQEPILNPFNQLLFDHIRDNLLGPYILITTERDSIPVQQIKERYGWPVVYYFHHIFAAHDWFRGYQYDYRIIAPTERKIKKKYITFNRLTSSLRVYRSLFVGKLAQLDILDQGHVSYTDTCPDGGTYIENLNQSVTDGLMTQEVANKAITALSTIQFPLRIDYKNNPTIPNRSMVLSAIEETQESFVYVVTETCFWETKCHLTEKIFKPIVSKMPFILVGCAFNLEYLKSYGFKTFDRWFDESYDKITDPLLRLDAISNLLKSICSYSNEELEKMLAEMQDVIDYNYNLFYSKSFIDSAWNELTTNLAAAVAPK
jgi:hypothetical protein